VKTALNFRFRKIRGKEVRDYLENYELLEKNSAVCRRLVHLVS